MASFCKKYPICKPVLFILCLFIAPFSAYSQIDIKVITPKQDSLVPSQNLFISVEADSDLHFASASSVAFYLDGYLITGLTKISGNRVRFVYPYKIRDGKHTIRIEAKFKEYKRPERGSWDFYAGKKDNRASTPDNGPPEKDKFKLRGIVSLDDREESVTGAGQALRQEPGYTRTVNVDAVASYKDMELPVKIFATTDNIPGIQNMNYFQVGFRNRWLELTGGDMNPVFDQLILNGVRVQGFGIKLKSHVSSIQFFYGNMTNAVNGLVLPYAPGIGVIPANLIDSTHYISPGTYRRMMMGARVELGSPSDEIKLCASVFKAKDDINSIQYGLDPKDNVVGGLDMVIKALHKKLVIKAGVAMSILTNDITGGAISRDSLEADYKVNPPFDPQNYKNIIILNSSTLPANISTSFNNLASYAQLNYGSKFQTFSIEVKDVGPLYYSLGNPFLLNDYQGINASERIYFLRRRITIGLGYQNYSNDLAQESYTKVYTQGYNGNLTVNPGVAWPVFMFNYLNLIRNGASVIDSFPGVNDALTNYMFNVSYSRTFWNLKQQFRLMLNISNRDDEVNPQNKYASVNAMFGVSEGISKQFTLNADVGKTVVTGYANSSISDFMVYDFNLDWQIKPQHYFTILSVSNNQTFLTPFSDPSYRLAVILKFGYRFLKGMGIDVEGGYSPFIDQANSSNSYNELYTYIRYSCDLGKLFGK